MIYVLESSLERPAEPSVLADDISSDCLDRVKVHWETIGGHELTIISIT